MAKIVFASRMGGEQQATLEREFPGATFVSAPDLESQLRELPDADAVISWPQREALLVAQRLRWVHCTSAGIERIRQLPELIEMDAVTLTNGRGAHAATIADHTFAFILAFTRNLRDIMEDQRAHRWERAARSQGARELSGSTLGILGLGKIGSEIARRAPGFGLQLRALDVNPAAEAPGVSEVWPRERLHEFLPTVDYLAIAIPITAETRHLIGARELALMRPDAYLCVMSRGGIVDQDALAEALKEGRLAGAGLDATEPEPLPAQHPLWDLPNVIISPHCSGASRQTGERGREILRQNLTRFLAGEPLINQCDKRAGF
ncbi:MAG TPA: D-2-hydroxyacid dehydrogenase [Chloroflexota bacterium]|nr:D-2-hydroxyacid dehydrogenase [Chloroflexota bacterium]